MRSSPVVAEQQSQRGSSTLDCPTRHCRGWVRSGHRRWPLHR